MADDRFRPGLEEFEPREVPAAFSFELPGAIGVGEFADPAGVNPAEPYQSIAVSDLTLQFQGESLTEADAGGGAVSAYYEFGALVGVGASFDLSAYNDLYVSLSLGGATATGVDAVSIPTTVPVVQLARPYVTMDFNAATAGSNYAITVRMDNDTVVTVFVNGAGKTAAQLAVAVRNELVAHGFGMNDVEVSSGIVTVWRKGDAAVEHVTVSIIGSDLYGRDYPFNREFVDGREPATGTVTVNFPP